MRRSAERIEPSDAGYTLTEMLVVIGIICLIAAVLTPSLLDQMARARYKSAELQLETVTSAVEQFRSDVGRYPTETEGLAALLSEPAGGAQGWVGPYLRNRKNLNDPWGRPIRYAMDPAARTFSVESYGQDGKPGGTGVNHDLRSPEAAVP